MTINNNISVETSLIEENNMIMVDVDTWSVFGYNLNSGKYECRWPLGCDEEGKLFWCVDCLHIGDDYYFLYRNCMRIKKYNTKTKHTKIYGFDEKLSQSDNVRKYGNFFEADGCIIILPRKLNMDVWKFDIEKEQFNSLGKLGEIVGLGVESEEYVTYYHWHNGSYWFGIEDTKLIGYISTKTLLGEVRKLDLQTEFNDIISPQKNIETDTLIILDKDANVYSYDGTELYILNIDESVKNERISSMLKYKDKYIVMTKKYDSILIYDVNCCLIKRIKLPDTFKKIWEMRRTDIALTRPIVAGKYCYYLPFSSNGIIRLDLENFDVYWLDTGIDSTETFYKLYPSEYLYEDKGYKLESYLSYIKNNISVGRI